MKICNSTKKWNAKSLANALGFAFARFMKICVSYFGKKATPKFCHTKETQKTQKATTNIDFAKFAIKYLSVAK